MAHVGDMTGQLMLVHGLIDENVHFRHTARLIGALIATQKRYELLLFPDERHMPRRKDDLVYILYGAADPRFHPGQPVMSERSPKTTRARGHRRGHGHVCRDQADRPVDTEKSCYTLFSCRLVRFRRGSRSSKRASNKMRFAWVQGAALAAMG